MPNIYETLTYVDIFDALSKFNASDKLHDYCTRNINGNGCLGYVDFSDQAVFTEEEKDPELAKQIKAFQVWGELDPEEDGTQVLFSW